MKKKKSITYNTLVNASKNVLFTLNVEKRDEVRLQDNSIFFDSMTSYRYLYGGHAPDDLMKLLDWKCLHMLRYKWCRILIKYYKIFIPELTLAKMWEIIKERRKERLEEQKKRWNREGVARERRDDGAETDGTLERLFPLSADKYYRFVLDHQDLIKKTEENGGLYRDSEIYCGYSSIKVYRWRSQNAFDIIIYKNPVNMRIQL
jgi:hypothetical protein